MMVLTAAVARNQVKALVATSAISLLTIPVAFAVLGGYTKSDWVDPTMHVGEKEFGWATLRFLTFDGNYPLIGWGVFPLLGAALLTSDFTRDSRVKRWFWCGLGLSIATQLSVDWVASRAEHLGGTAPYLASTWTPVTVPFVLVTGSSAFTLLAGLAWLDRQGRLSQLAGPIACFGRASLTHYILHICVAVAPLRLLFPAEDWPLLVGLPAAVAYVSITMPLTVIWCRKYSRGPIEMLWAAASRPARPLVAASLAQFCNHAGHQLR
jgi:uncharacterized membrane protein YeiB